MTCINCDSLVLVKVLLKKKGIFSVEKKYSEQVIVEVYETALFK